MPRTNLPPSKPTLPLSNEGWSKVKPVNFFLGRQGKPKKIHINTKLRMWDLFKKNCISTMH